MFKGTQIALFVIPGQLPDVLRSTRYFHPAQEAPASREKVAWLAVLTWNWIVSLEKSVVWGTRVMSSM